MNIYKLAIIMDTARHVRAKMKEAGVGWNDLEGACAIASIYFFHLLKAYGFKPVLVHSNYHAWVEVGSLAVDITASQFGNYPPIFVFGASNTPTKWWERVGRFTNIRDFKSQLKAHQWPDDQIPRSVGWIEQQIYGNHNRRM